MEIKNKNSTENTDAKGTDKLNTKAVNNHAKTTAENTTPPRFTKEQLVQSTKYGNHRDLLHALLEDGKSYNYQEADNIIEEFNKKGGV